MLSSFFIFYHGLVEALFWVGACEPMSQILLGKSWRKGNLKLRAGLGQVGEIAEGVSEIPTGRIMQEKAEGLKFDLIIAVVLNFMTPWHWILSCLAQHLPYFPALPNLVGNISAHIPSNCAEIPDLFVA